ncbi:MAG: hypothetical protein MI807_22530 [Verrucomicrobiales bacterium]|nr:hypothetical protein [Verrucomicrobiales bacterium]
MALGSLVSVKKVTGHPRGYKWRANFVEEGRRKQKYFKTKSAADKWAEEREEESQEHGTSKSLSGAERSTVIDTRDKLIEVDLDIREAIEFAIRAKEATSPFEITPEEAIQFAVAITGKQAVRFPWLNWSRR